MELVSDTEDENDLLNFYSDIIRIVFNDQIEEEDIEQLDVAEITGIFKVVTFCLRCLYLVLTCHKLHLCKHGLHLTGKFARVCS